MIGKILGAVIGNQIDRSDGRGGLKGAAMGMLTASVLRRLGPAGLVIGGAYAAKKMYDARKSRGSYPNAR